MVVSWRHRRSPLFAGHVVRSSPVSWIVELRLFIFIISLEAAWFWSLGCSSCELLETVELVDRSQGKFVQFFHLLVLGTNGFEPVRLLIVVWLINPGWIGRFLLTLPYRWNVSTASPLEQQWQVVLSFFPLGDRPLRKASNHAQIRNLADHSLDIAGKSLEVDGRWVCVILRQFDQTLMIEFFSHPIFEVLANLLWGGQCASG